MRRRSTFERCEVNLYHLGPFSKVPKTFRTHNNTVKPYVYRAVLLHNFNTNKVNFHAKFNAYTLLSFLRYIYGPDKLSGPSRNGPLIQSDTWQFSVFSIKALLDRGQTREICEKQEKILQRKGGDFCCSKFVTLPVSCRFTNFLVLY